MGISLMFVESSLREIYNFIYFFTNHKMSPVHILIGVIFIIFAVLMILVLYNNAIAPTYGFPTIWGSN